MASSLLPNLIPQVNFPQTQNLPTTINLDWLNKFQNTQPSSQNQGGFLNLQPYYSRTDINFLNLNSDGVKYSRNEDGTLGRVAGVSKTVENAPEIAATEAGQNEKQLLKTQETQATPVNAQTTAPVQQTTPETNAQSQTTIADAIKNYKSSLDALNGNRNPTQLLNLKDARTSILPVIPDRNQYNNNSLLKLQNIEPENWTPQQWGWMGDIYSAKMAYEADTANIDWYNQQLAKTDLSDADRKKYTDARDGLIKKRENVMNEAAMIRRTALANGFDIDAMGMSALGDNLGASTQAMNYFQERNRKSLLDLPTPKQFNNQRRKELDEQGYGAFHSLMLADKETSDYIDDASNKLLYAMQMDGTTNGVINNNGIGYLKQLSKIDPTSANIFMQEYASPAQGLQLQTQTLNNILNNDSALQRTLLNNQASYQQLLERLATTKEIAKINDLTRRYDIDLTNDYRNANLQAQIEKANAENRRELVKQQFEIQKWAANNDPQAVQYLADILFGSEETEDKQNWKRTKLNSSYKPADSKESKALQNDIGNRLHIIRNALLNGEVDEDGNEIAKNELAKLKADLRDSEKKYLGIDPKVYADATIMTGYYDKVFSGQMSLWDIDDLAWRLEHEGRDPNTNENGDPIWYIKMPPKEREKYDKYLAKERGFNPKKTTSSNNKTISNQTTQNYTYTPGGNYLPPTYQLGHY